jgi:hypothetical protein
MHGIMMQSAVECLLPGDDEMLTLENLIES